MTEEHKIQNAIRNDLAGECLLFRANVGNGWASSKPPVRATKPMMVALMPGDVVLRAARPFSTGLPPGFSDLFGLKKTLITQEMVGSHLGVFIAPEVKAAKGRASEAQTRFIRAVNDNGGKAGIVRNTADARKLIGADDATNK